MPLNNKETMLQRQISFDREDAESDLEALEEPLKPKKRRESRQGINYTHNFKLIFLRSMRSSTFIRKFIICKQLVCLV